MSKLLSPLLITGLILTLACIATAANPPGDSTDDWPSYGHDPGGMRYSPLTQINRENVAKLKIAWIFHTGDISDGKGQRKRSGFETTPLVVDGTLYLTTPFNRVIALDPEIGKQRWAYDPKIDLSGDYGDGLINRGVATWLDPTRPATQPCRRRLFEATLDARLIALDAATGAPCADFGKAGEVAFDPQRNLLFVNTNNFPFRVRLIPSEKFMEEVMKGGGEFGSQRGAPYGVFRAPFFSPSFVPCSPPPWGTLTAVDMAEGKIRWQVPLGSMQNFGVAHTTPLPPGSPSLGGPIVTAGGLVFIAGTIDPVIRAFDVETGKELWKAQLPTNGHAVPMTYQLNAKGKQYVVIAAGSHAKIKEEPLGDALVAFTLQ